MKNKHVGSSLDSLFDSLGEGGELRLLTLKKLIAERFLEQMERAGMTQSKLAAAMGTSRTITHRLLDPTDTGVTLDTLVRASEALGLELDVTFRVKAKTLPRVPRRRQKAAS